MQTVQATIFNIKTSKTDKIRLLFDSGFWHSNITDDVKSKLNLAVLRKERILIKIFGKEKTEIRNVDVVQFKIIIEHVIFVEALSGKH